MRSFKYCTVAAATLFTVCGAFAQTSSSDSASMPMQPAGTSSSMGAASATGTTGTTGTTGMSGTMTQDNSATSANVNARAPATMDTGSRGYDSTTARSPQMSVTSGGSGTMGTYASGQGRYGDYANGSQLNVSDVHATPQPGTQNNQLFRGN